MKRQIITVLLCSVALLTYVGTASVHAAPVAGLVISEVKVKSGGDYDEFIELYNPTSAPVDLSAISLEYDNATAPGKPPTPALSARLPAALLAAQDYLVLAKNPASIPGAAHLPFSALKDDGGTLRLVAFADPHTVYDQISWTTTSIVPAGMWSAGTGNNTVSKTQSLQPQTGADGMTTWALAMPQPQSNTLTLVPESTPPPDSPPVTENTPSAEPAVGAPQGSVSPSVPVRITELLPNPAAPLVDASDEFVEVYNPTDEPADMHGYKLQTGSNYTHSFTIDTLILQPHTYASLYSRDTKLALSNTSGRARLLAPDGTTLAETEPYGATAAGQAWAEDGGIWKWTTTVTPDAATIVTAPSVAIKPKPKAIATVAKKAATAPKPFPTTKAPAPKVAGATTAKPKATTGAAAKTSKAAATPDNQQPAAGAADKPPLHPAILAGIGGITVAYGAYEYRQDLANYFIRFKRDRATRRAARATAAGR